jgi:hypothetical protein
MSTDDLLRQQIAAMLPKSLDDIVRINRQHLTIRLATETEVMALHHAIAPDRAPAMTIDDWRWVAFDMAFESHRQTDISLLGNKPNQGVRITSPVKKVDLDRRLVITQSGTLYGLGKQGEGEPPFEHLAMVCSACYSWGFGSTFGIPHFFY